MQGPLYITSDHELLNPLAPVLGDIDIALGVHRDAVRLVEMTREVPGAAETRQDSASLALDDLDS